MFPSPLLPVTFGTRLLARSLRMTSATIRGVADILDPSGVLAGRPAEPLPVDESLADSAAQEAASSRGAPPPREPAPPPPARRQQPSTPRRPAAQESPRHVSQEPELVDARADVGAEPGPGPEVHVSEPWLGYGRLKAADVIERLPVEQDGTIALVRLYESQNRGRRRILEAAERELRRRSNPARHR